MALAVVPPQSDPADMSEDAGAAQHDRLEDLATHQAWPIAIQLSATHVYWANWGAYLTGGIARVGKRGGEVETLATSERRPDSLYLDDHYAYWAERMGAAPHRTPLEGGQSELLGDGTAFFTWALGDETFYFNAITSSGVISSMPKSGGPTNTFIIPSDTIANTDPLFIRVHQNAVYWSRQVNPDDGSESTVRLYRAAEGGGPEELIVEERAIAFGDVVFDQDNLYWTVPERHIECLPPTAACATHGEVRAKSLRGGEAHTLAGGEDHPGPLALDADRIYWTTPRSLRSARKDGSDPQTLTVLAGGVYTIAVDSEAVYWATYDEEGSIGRILK